MIKSRKKQPNLKKKSAVSSRQCTVSQIYKTTAKLHESSYELLLHSPYSPDQAFTDLFLFADLKRMLAGKKISTNEEAVVEN
jgi:hypothetical protein